MLLHGTVLWLALLHLPKLQPEQHQEPLQSGEGGQNQGFGDRNGGSTLGTSSGLGITLGSRLVQLLLIVWFWTSYFTSLTLACDMAIATVLVSWGFLGVT